MSSIQVIKEITEELQFYEEMKRKVLLLNKWINCANYKLRKKQREAEAKRQNEEREAKLQAEKEEREAKLQKEEREAKLQKEEREALLQAEKEEREAKLQAEERLKMEEMRTQLELARDINTGKSAK